MSVSLEPVCRDVLHLTRKLMRRRKATLIKVDYSPDLWSQRSCIENVICLLKLVSKSQCWAGFVALLPGITICILLCVWWECRRLFCLALHVNVKCVAVLDGVLWGSHQISQ